MTPEQLVEIQGRAETWWMFPEIRQDLMDLLALVRSQTDGWARCEAFARRKSIEADAILTFLMDECGWDGESEELIDGVRWLAERAKANGGVVRAEVTPYPCMSHGCFERVSMWGATCALCTAKAADYLRADLRDPTVQA